MDIKKKIPRIILITLVTISLFFVLKEWVREEEKTDEEGQGPLLDWVKELVMEPYLPAISRMNGGKGSTFQGDMITRGVLLEYPVVLFYLEGTDDQESVTESDYARLLVLEGSDEDRKSIEEGELEYGDDAMHLEQSMENELLKENERFLSAQSQEEVNDVTEEAILFQPAEEKSFRYQWEELADYDNLIKAFYAVDSTTKAGEELLEAKELLSRDMRIRGSADEPQILIYHTHSQEAFVDSVPGDENSGILGAGEYLASLLRERYGYNVLHHTACYDADRDYAYSNSLPEIEKLLQENPSIEVVIDLHRDAMPAERRLVMNLQGRPTAQFMFFNGLSRTKKGEISYLENPYLEDNLAFSFQMQAACNEYYPGIARRIYLKAYRYNMHVCPKTLLIELGAQNNTEEEIHNACDPLAHVLHMVLSGKEPER